MNDGWGKLKIVADEPPFARYFKTYFTQTWETTEHTKKKPQLFTEVHDSRTGLVVYTSRIVASRAMSLSAAQSWIGLETMDAPARHIEKRRRRA